MKLREKYSKLLKALELIGSYEYCSCGCPGRAKAFIAGKPAVTWSIANKALKNVGHKIKVHDENISYI